MRIGTIPIRPSGSSWNAIIARGEWGGEFHPDFTPKPGDIVVDEHWGQSGFANTDLDFRLKQNGITYVTLVRDATAAVRPEMMHAAHELNGPTFAHAILTTSEVIAALPKA